MTADTNAKLCPECGSRARVPGVIPYESKVVLDRRDVGVCVAELPVEKCTNCEEVYFGAEAGIAIDDATRKAAGRLTPEDLVRARQALGGMSQKELASETGVAPEAMSRWAKGHVIQGRLADTMMRVFFAVPEARHFLQSLWATPEHDRRLAVVSDRYPRPAAYSAAGWHTFADLSRLASTSERKDEAA